MDKYDKVIELAKRRGFLWSSFELYGGMAGFYDYGPLGAMLKRRIEDLWREVYVIKEGFYEIEAPTISIEDVFIASGHVGGFSDPLIECQKCKEAFRADHLVENIIEMADSLSADELTKIIQEKNIKCPDCGGRLGEVYEFNLMFKTTIGPGSKRLGYLRPETAQGMFIDFPRLLRFYRDKLPFGATQIGKAYRNEISPRQGVIRLREFTQAEAEVFIDPRDKKHPRFAEAADLIMRLYSREAQQMGEAEEMRLREALDRGIISHEFLGYHLAQTQLFLTMVGISPDKLRFRQHQKDEIAHYAADCWDAEVLSERFGWIELVGIADRTDYDLKSHGAKSKTPLSVYVPYDKPKKVEVFKVKPNMSIIGPRFKGRAKAVVEALGALKIEEIREDKVEIKVDGEKIVLGRDAFTFETGIEEVYGENIIPHVIEPSYGIDRILYALLEHSYSEEKVPAEEGVEEETRVVLKLPSKVAPIQAAILPLLTRPELIKVAGGILKALKEKGLVVSYDDSGTIGRRYRRNDEIGTPYSITIDYETLEDQTITIRDRDTMKQVRAPVSELAEIIFGLIYKGEAFEKAGVPV